MASGPLTFRTPYIEEIPISNAKQAPGFAWVAVPNIDPAKKALEVASKKRARTSAATTEIQKDVLSNRRQREIERRIKELNTEGSKDVNIPIPKDTNVSSSGVKAGKTSNTKKILASGKEFKHYLDDEEAELARTGRIDGIERDEIPQQRPSKTPIARRVQQEHIPMDQGSKPPLPFFSQPTIDDGTDQDDFDAILPFPSADVVQALLDAPPLTYNAARLTPTYAPTAPPRTFCEICGFWGRSLCLKCGARTCSVDCEAIHVADRCLKFYA
ncbi:hypothetical protein AMS68_006072 [Peltaster fructicola]|uniref:HIT-type domain-containing protein n=1 Tax=Peltaster fructicola TaxID=286661 RepID=A0A6H0Y0W8_9PEZI|nr:hypothetical protein AMS68_006072 [Peltaster fructicola]